MNGIIFCVFFNISFFSSTSCLQAMSKRTQEGAGEERVTAKSRPMTNLVSRCRTGNPTVLASTESVNPGNTKSESQKVPLSSPMIQRTGTGQPVTSKSEILSRSSFSSDRKNDDKWSSQVWKSGRMSRTGTGQPVTWS